MFQEEKPLDENSKEELKKKVEETIKRYNWTPMKFVEEKVSED